MAMNRDKFRNIVGGITTPETKPQALPPAQPTAVAPHDEADTTATRETVPAGEGTGDNDSGDGADHPPLADQRRFAKRGRPKGSKPPDQTGATRKVKVSLFLSEIIVNDLYEWAHADRMHPGEMFEAALKPFHERESKRRKGGKE